MNAKRLPSGNYRVRLFTGRDAGGKKHYKSFTAPTKKEAELLALQYNRKKNPGELTFEDALENYISSREHVLSPATVKKYRSFQRSTYLDALKPVKIDSIQASDIQSVMNAMGLNCAPKTVWSMHGFIAGILKANDLPEFKVTLPQKQRPKLYLPSDDDIQRLFDAVNGTNYEIPVCLAAIGCMRRAEICAFTKSDIKGNVLHICKEMVLNDSGEWVIKRPKSYKGDRFVQLPDFLIKKIMDMPGDTVGLTPNSITNHFPRILKKAGLPHFKFHDLRHYGASVLSKLGVNTYTIMSICGWESESMLNNIYRYLFDDELSKAANLSASHFDRMTRNMT